MLCNKVRKAKNLVLEIIYLNFDISSGESGSGKTESTKLFLKQLMYLCGGSSQLEQQILQVRIFLNYIEKKRTPLIGCITLGNTIIRKFW